MLPCKEADYERILWRKARRLCLRASSEQEAVSQVRDKL